MSSRTFTAAQCIGRLRLICDWTNVDSDYSEAGSYMSSGTLVQFLDVGHAYAWNVFAEADEGWNATRSQITTVPGTGSYDCPADMLFLRSVEVQYTGAVTGWRPITRATVDDDGYVGGVTVAGGPTCYRLIDEQIELLPPPGESTQVRLTYQPVAPVISGPTDVIDGVSGFEHVSILRAGILGRIRERQDYGDLADQLRQHEEQFRREVRRRDRGTPAHTRDRRDAVGQRYRRRGY